MQWVVGLVVAVGIAVSVAVDRWRDPVGSVGTIGQVVVKQSDSAGFDSAKLDSSVPTVISPSTETPEFHAVSLPALQQYALNGHDFRLGDVQPSSGSYTRYHLTYESDDLTISGVMNVPVGDGPFPVLFLNHGYIDPAVYTNGRGLKREQDYFARRGFAVLHSDYRCHAQSDCDGSDEFTLRLGYVRDVLNAIEAVRVSGDQLFDLKRFGMFGHSMGGGIALNAMVAKPDIVDAYILYAPVSSDLRDNFDRWTTRRPAEAKKISELYGSPEESPTFWDQLSPRTYFSQVTGSIMVHHGTADDSVPIAWSDETVEALKQAGRDVTYHVYPGQPHEFGGGWTSMMDRSVDFFRQQLSDS